MDTYEYLKIVEALIERQNRIRTFFWRLLVLGGGIVLIMGIVLFYLQGGFQ